MRIHPMIAGIAIGIDDPDKSSADDLSGLRLATSAQDLVPIVFTDSELVECQHGVRLARLLADV